MSYKEALSDLDRSGPSLTGQIVGLIAAAVAEGELEPGEQLPTTRELAKLAGVNHLTAARAYRRLADEGLVTATRGKGTFVRHRPAPSPDGDRPGETSVPSDAASWQRYALPEIAEDPGDRVLGEMFSRLGEEDGVIPMLAGYPSPRIFPVAELERITHDVLVDEGAAVHQYVNIEGVAGLRAQLAKLVVDEGGAAEAADVMVTTGARQGLALAARAVLSAGDVAACESPTFPSVAQSLRAAGAKVVAIPSGEDGLDLDALEQVLRRHEIRALALQPRIHNPTGRDLLPESRTRLAELARRHGFFVIEDEVHAALRFGPEASPPPLQAELPEHAILVGSLSKTVSPGLRTGWIVARGPVRERLARAKRDADMNSAVLPQLIAERFLAEGLYRAQVGRAVEHYRERQRAVVEAVDEKLGGLARRSEPLGGSNLWLELTRPVDEQELYSEALRCGVSFMPGRAMMPDRPWATCLRLASGFLDPPELVEGVARLGAAIRAVGAPEPRGGALAVN